MGSYQTIIIGSGPAGLSASIYLGRAKIKTLVIGKKEQSQLIDAYQIENYFGFPGGITGPVLIDKGLKQVKKSGVELKEGEVVDICKEKEGFSIKLGDGEKHLTRTIIIATGVALKLSGIENENRLANKGIHYCVISDGVKYNKKNIVVLGNGDHAAEEVFDALTFTSKVSLISHSDKFELSEESKRFLEKNKVKMVNAKARAFQGGTKLEKVILEDGKEIKTDAVFIALRNTSALDFANKLGLEKERNRIRIDSENKTNIEGVFAAGNCCSKTRQIANNVGEGCSAALSAIRYLKHRETYIDYGPLKK